VNETEISRRGFLNALGVAGLLSLGCEIGCGGVRASVIRRADQTGDLSPNAFVTVKKDGRVQVAIDKAEFGQGVATMYSTLVAEELDVPFDRIDFHFADSLPEYRTSLNIQLTGGSSSTREGYLPLRLAAASAREMLVVAAAGEWGALPSDCKTDAGFVIHEPTKRKLGYGSLTIKAAHQPIPEKPKLKAPSQFKLIGKQGKRVDLRQKVDGSARFGIDVVIPNMVRAYVIHGPVFGAQAKSVRADVAKKMRGIIDVFAFPGGVAIVAEKYWQARAAAPFVDIAWDDGEVEGLDTETMRKAVRAYSDDGDSVRNDGNADKAITHSTAKITAIYEGPFLAHAPMEPQNCTALVTGNKVEIWAPCQAPSLVQSYVAHALGISDDDVLVHTTLMGGAFGRRILADFAVQAAHIAKRIQRPVQMIWTRESDMTQGFYRPQLTAKMRGGVTADGRVAGVAIHSIGQSILLDSASAVPAAIPGVPRGIQSVITSSLKALIASDTITDMFTTEGISDTVYAIENFDVSVTPINTNLPVASWRSVGHSFNGFVMESTIDELAHAAKIDPLEFRRRTLPSSSRAHRVLDAVAALAKWGARTPGIGRGIARHESFETEVAEIADVEIVNGRIKVRRVFVAVDCGTVVNPDIVRAQVEGAIIFGLSAALDQEITLTNGVVMQKNFDAYPPLRMHESPEITVQIIASEKPPTGIGEPALPPIGPAVANAIFELTGIRLRRLPLQRAWNEAHA
jgi:isoquinoline 1-oxidoreductase beta subunit